MTLEDLHASLPPELRVTPETLPENIRSCVGVQAALGALIDCRHARGPAPDLRRMEGRPHG